MHGAAAGVEPSIRFTPGDADADAEFTIPSTSKPFVFALPLEILGRDRNRAFGHLLRSYDLVRGDVSDAVEAYFRQCSVRVTVADVAVMAGTLASAR